MKIHLFAFCAALLACGLAPGLAAPEENPAQKLVDDALLDFEAKKYDDALQKLQEADKLTPSSPFVLNLIGAAYTKKQDYENARTSFDKALEQDSSFFPARFNVGELLFLQKQYPQALDYFRKMLGTDPGNELLQFKVILCLLQTNQIEDAQKLFKRMRFPGDGPAWYFAQAALLIKEGNNRKAAEFVSSATTIFPDKVAIFKETFQDLGWPVK